MEPMEGVIDTSASGATASVEVFGIPPGQAYLVELYAVTVRSAKSCVEVMPSSTSTQASRPR